MINKNGNAEFNNATVRGTVYATAGEFSGKITSNDGYFGGTVYANKLEGDIIRSYSVPVNTVLTIPAQPFARTLAIPVIIANASSQSVGTATTITGTAVVNLYVNGNLVISNTSISSNGSRVALYSNSFSAEIPANSVTTVDYRGSAYTSPAGSNNASANILSAIQVFASKS
ncbi:putative phage tail protein [Yersinia kristensenii]|nr:putative phage tail protein [Yersinia kristensenii]